MAVSIPIPALLRERTTRMSSEDTKEPERSENGTDEQEPLSDYVSDHLSDPTSVEEYRKITNIGEFAVPIGLSFPILVYLLFNMATPDQLILIDFSSIESSVFSILVSGVAVFLGVIPVWYITSLEISHKLDDRQLSRHKLALAIDTYLNSDLDKTVEHLENVKSTLRQIAHPQLASAASDLISNHADPEEPETIDTIMDNHIRLIAENERRAELGSEYAENILFEGEEKEENQSSATYHGIILEDIQARAGGRISDLLILSLLALGVLLVYFYISQGLAGILGTLAATFGTYLLAQRRQ